MVEQILVVVVINIGKKKIANKDKLFFQYIPVCRLGWHIGKPKIILGNVIWQLCLGKICISKYRQNN